MLNSKKNQSLSVGKLILIVLATEFGFSNVVSGYNQMGYASIIWYVICAIVFLFPLAMIFAEYSGALKKDHGGFYTWLIDSFGEKWAFIGTFVWIASFVVNLLQNVTGLGINFSGAVHGTDTSQHWQLGFLNNNEIEALLGIVFIVASTYFATKGVHKIALTAMIAGIVSLSVIGIFIIASIVIALRNGQIAQPIHGVKSFIKSPSPAFQSPITVMSFIIYAMFAYSGMESTSGMIDKMKHPQKQFPKAMIWTAIIEMTLYVLGIFICGLATNWNQVMGKPGVNLYNNGFYLMNNLGVGLARSLGWSNVTGLTLGGVMNRILCITGFLPLIGFLTITIYSPIKGLIAGSSKDLWPEKIAQFNRHGMPAGAMWIECGLIVLALALISVTGNSGQQFYQIIVDMGNISAVAPYFFIVVGFVLFKKRHDLDRKIVFFHSKFSVYLTVGVLLISMTFGVVMNIIEPLLSHQYSTAFWTVIGPIFFLVISGVMYHFGIVHRAKRMIADNEAYVSGK